MAVNQAASASAPARAVTGRRISDLVLLLLLLLACFATLSQLPLRSTSTLPASAFRQHAGRHAGTNTSPRHGQVPRRIGRSMALREALAMLRHSKKRYVVVDVKNGLGNRLRALASAMSVAHSLKRPLLLVWVPDLHCNCSFARLFQELPFVLLEEPIPSERLSVQDFQVYNYMRGEPGAVKEEAVEVDPDRHLYFKSAYVMNHPMGRWASGGPQRCVQPRLHGCFSKRPAGLNDTCERHRLPLDSTERFGVRGTFAAPVDSLLRP